MPSLPQPRGPVRFDNGVKSEWRANANSIADFFGLEAVVFPDLLYSTQEVTGAAGIIRFSSELLLERKATEPR
jgi:hypothetical protein